MIAGQNRGEIVRSEVFMRDEYYARGKRKNVDDRTWER